MTVASELWFGLFKDVGIEVQRRVAASTNVFDELLIELLGQCRPVFRAYRASIQIPTELNPSSDSHVAIAGLLLAASSAGDEARSYARVLDTGLKKIKLKSPAAGMPAFANDWKLLLGAAAGIGVAIRLACDGDWSAHRAHILSALEGLPQTDLTSAVMVAFAKRQLAEERTIGMQTADPSALTTAELISIVWANHVRLTVPISEESCWAALQSRLDGIRVEDLGFHELSLLLVVLKDNWASGWSVNRAQGVGFVRATLRDFLPCAKRDIKSELVLRPREVLGMKHFVLIMF